MKAYRAAQLGKRVARPLAARLRTRFRGDPCDGAAAAREDHWLPGPSYFLGQPSQFPPRRDDGNASHHVYIDNVHLGVTRGNRALARINRSPPILPARGGLH